jgi:hypothetical protein
MKYSVRGGIMSLKLCIYFNIYIYLYIFIFILGSKSGVTDIIVLHVSVIIS